MVTAREKPMYSGRFHGTLCLCTSAYFLAEDMIAANQLPGRVHRCRSS